VIEGKNGKNTVISAQNCGNQPESSSFLALGVAKSPIGAHIPFDGEEA
jgi:hypothetical protein